MTSKNSNQNVIAGFLVALLALAGLNIYQYINRNSLVAANKEQETEIIALDKAKTELDKEYYEALSDLEEMKSSNAELNQMIDGQKEELTKQKNRISSLLRDSRNLKKAKEEIEKLSQQGEEYLAEITVLREENEKLNIDNTALKESNTTLEAKVDSQSMENEELTSLKSQLENENESLASEKDILNKKVNMASTIEVDDVDIKGFQMRESGKLRRRRSADRVELLKVCFSILPNELAASGSETFYVRIIDPIGETFAVEKRGSGITNIGMNNSPIRYSTAMKADYNQQEKMICTEWNPGRKFLEGTYSVEIYNKGFLSGEGRFRLR